MFHCFVSPEMMDDRQVRITGPDVNHIKNVMRMKPGANLYVSDGSGRNVLACVKELGDDEVICGIIGTADGRRELPVDITLYQGLPKSDKLETVIQKSVELGAVRIVPVAMARSIVKLDEKKAAAKRDRWQAIAESAAKQSQREIIPEVGPVMTFSQAIEEACSYGSGPESGVLNLIPYELSQDAESVRTAWDAVRTGQVRRINIFIGPEGGIDEAEIEAAAAAGIMPVTLGKRILRTETAGVALIAALMLWIEIFGTDA